MWHPPDPVKHPLPEASWPTAEEASRSLLFQPIAVGPVELRERTWVPAMVPWRATEEGYVTEEVIEWYRRFAEGRPGALVVEATGVRDIRSGPLLRIGHDRFLPGLERLVDTVRDASGGRTRLFIQLIDFLTIRRRPTKEKFFHKYLAVTDRLERVTGLEGDALRTFLAEEASEEELEEILEPRDLESLRYGYRERVTDLHLEHIRELPQTLPPTFAEAARRAERAGFDGVELHYAHAYTMASFLSGLNTREDGYGGDLAGRVRLPLEVHAAVKEAVSPSFAVGCRFLSAECIAGGYGVDDACEFAVEFARAGMHFLSLSRGGKFEDAKQPKVGQAAYPYTGPSGYECMPTVRSDRQGPFGRNVPAVAAIRSRVRAAGYQVPVVVSGGIGTFDQANSILEEGAADIVAAARQSLADPDWFLKMSLGRGDEIRRCVFTNYCEGLDQVHKQVTCKLWDRKELEEEGILRSTDGKRRLTAPRWKNGPTG